MKLLDNFQNTHSDHLANINGKNSIATLVRIAQRTRGAIHRGAQLKESTMYHAIVRRRVLGIFEALGRGDYEVALAGFAPRFEHIFAGTHALGGERHTIAAMRLWFQRLFRLLPHLAFNVKHIAVSGSPWNTTIVVEWRDTATLPGGTPYVNDGAHVMRMRWGKVTHLHAYLDTEIIALAFRKMAAEGTEEAQADPIRD
jgi:ketosteroid isomerase-like protein